MDRWYNYVESIESLKSIYGEDIPSLKEIKVKEIIFYQDGPRIVSKIDLPVLPKSLPVKWKAKGYNTISIELQFIEISKLSFIDWKLINRCSVEILKKSEILHVTFSGDITLNLECKWLHVNSISAYENLD